MMSRAGCGTINTGPVATSRWKMGAMSAKTRDKSSKRGIEGGSLDKSVTTETGEKLRHHLSSSCQLLSKYHTPHSDNTRDMADKLSSDAPLDGTEMHLRKFLNVPVPKYEHY